ncbi:hypothetical protein ACTID9_01025 [Brevibacillus fluminis]|uniref:hypothetical protein n=1 Tax=Brevibacillus fluminis TaxID=511487 RepID=UPI003F8AEC8A
MSIKETISVDEVVQLLNQLSIEDKTAMENLICARVECNEAVANHPTVQVSQDAFKVGMLGVLNGLFGVAQDGFGAIAADFDENGLKGFVRIR